VFGGRSDCDPHEYCGINQNHSNSNSGILFKKRFYLATRSRIFSAISAHRGPLPLRARCPPSFAGVDLGDAQPSVDTFIIQGFRFGSMVFSQSGS
jgi:hypothetical protein